MALLLIQGGDWDIRGLVHGPYWHWMVGFVIVYMLSGVLVYFKLRRPRDKSASRAKNA